ncbi:DUF397 domain-containing protein [Micromonospora sp. NPDC000089]|uniref:DUF397 domain-containing protein n=1 Tax=unclassified Micromonospora TaxID=2617518 RepID=UPI00368A33A1
MIAFDLTGAAWRTSSRSIGNGNCVEVAAIDRAVAVRDSKDRAGGALVFSPAAWRSFVAGVDAVRAG